MGEESKSATQNRQYPFHSLWSHNNYLLLIAMFGSVALNSFAGEAGVVMRGMLPLIAIQHLIMMSIGIIGVVKKSGDQNNAGFYIITGAILCAFEVVMNVIGLANGSYQWTGIIGFVLPIISIVGGVKNKKVAVAQAQ